jgi:hypothetical protein
MKKRLLAALVMVLAGGGAVSAQSPPSTAVTEPWFGTGETSAGAGSCLSDAGGARDARLGANAEYLLWWVKHGPAAPPLLTTSSSPDATGAGAIGANGTRVLIGDRDFDYGTLSGLRLTLTGWLDGDSTFGLEGSAFLLERRMTASNAASDGAVTFFSPAVEVVPPVGNVAFRFPPTGPGLLTTASLTSQSRLWGAEANLAVNAARSGGWAFDLLGGFRYADLQESANYDTQSQATASAGTSITTADYFATQNHFYGGQLGARAEFQRDRFFATAFAKVALGVTHEAIAINGNSLSMTPEGPTPLAPGGIYTGNSNIGRATQDRFAVIPEAGISAGVCLTSHLRATLGYDFLYWSNVARPGSQIDPRVDFTDPRPVAPVNPRSTTGFWAQGITFGLELRF